MPNSFLTNNELKLILFGGKGGSGKTTSACATALYLGQKYRSKKILIVSTDPAPSVGDSLDIEVGNKITKIEENLWAIEFNAKELAEEFRKKNLEKIKTLILRGTYLTEEDIEIFENLALPGMDEVMAVIKIADLLKIHPVKSREAGSPEAKFNRVGKYDLIILDTAPTGHTKVLLSLPEKMERWIAVVEVMQEKHRFLKRHWTGRYVKDEYDGFLENLRADITGVEDLLKNYDLTEFVPVTIPEPMSILETEALLEDLEKMEIKVKSIIVNQVAMGEEKCPLCFSRMKRQESYLKMIEEKFKDYQILKMPLFPTEIRGQDSLSEYAKILFGEKPSTRAKPGTRAGLGSGLSRTELRSSSGLGAGLVPPRPALYAKFIKPEKQTISLEGGAGAGEFKVALPKLLPNPEPEPSARYGARFPEIPESKMADFLKKDLNFIICGGKGGVGKTSIAAATAIALAKKHKDKKILITTTDPAHALSNIFDQDIPIGREAVSITGFNNLEALEIDAQKILEDFKDAYRQDIREAFEIGEGIDVAFDRKTMEELMDFSPPGLEELMALRKVMELMKEGRYNFYVLDSAASGHLLRFLETPAIIRDWLKGIFQILLKFRGLTGNFYNTKVQLLNLSKDMKRVQEILFGSKTTQFLMISIAEEMGIREMGDLAQSLEKLNVSNHYIILNMIVPVSLYPVGSRRDSFGACRFCLTKRENQEKYISRVRKDYNPPTTLPLAKGEWAPYPKKEIVLVPLFPHDIRGIESLKELSKFLFG